MSVLYHQRVEEAGKWVSVCPVCETRYPCTRDPDDLEALRLSAAAINHYKSHLPVVSTTGMNHERQ